MRTVSTFLCAYVTTVVFHGTQLRLYRVPVAVLCVGGPRARDVMFCRGDGNRSVTGTSSVAPPFTRSEHSPALLTSMLRACHLRQEEARSTRTPTHGPSRAIHLTSFPKLTHTHTAPDMGPVNLRIVDFKFRKQSKNQNTRVPRPSPSPFNDSKPPHIMRVVLALEFPW